MSATHDAQPAASSSPPFNPSLLDIFVVFASVSLSGFGGVLAWARRALVERRKWMTPEEFNDLFALSQFLPGPNIVNLSVVYGARLRGPAGSAAAFCGLLGPPLIIVTIFGILYAHFADVDGVRRALAGLSAAASGMLIATVAKMSQPLRASWLAVVIALGTFVAIGVMRWPMPVVLPLLLPMAIGLAWWVRR